jgi:hypothetical protein
LDPKLSGACYAVRSTSHISNTDIVKSTYFTYCHSLKYGIIFWGNSSDRKKKGIYTAKENCKNHDCIKSRNSCTDISKRLEIWTLPCEFINFITSDVVHFQTNEDVHSVNTRHKHYPHTPTANLSCFQESVHHAVIKIFSNLPSNLKSPDSKIIPFYSVDEYLLSKKMTNLFKGYVNNISWQQWCIHLNVFLNSFMRNHWFLGVSHVKTSVALYKFLYFYNIFRVLRHSNFESRKRNVMNIHSHFINNVTLIMQQFSIFSFFGNFPVSHWRL